MTQYRLQRKGDVDVMFDGDIIGEASSHEPGRHRWQEIRIYRTSTNRWVVEQTGCSAVHGEVPLTRAVVCDSPARVRTALESNQPPRVYMTDTALEALDAAVVNDPRLAPEAVDRV